MNDEKQDRPLQDALKQARKEKEPILGGVIMRPLYETSTAEGIDWEQRRWDAVMAFIHCGVMDDQAITYADALIKAYRESEHD